QTANSFVGLDSRSGQTRRRANREHTSAVTAITLNWNRREDTLACLASLQVVSYRNLDVVLVDNGSTDGTVEAVRRQFPEVEILENTSNLGYAAGCNRALRRFLSGESDYVLLLNNDTVVAPDMVDRLVETALTYPDVGMLGPTVWYYDDPGRLWSAGQRCRPITLSGQPPHVDPQVETPYEVDYLFGCGLLLKRQLLEDVGLFDERFFMYYEDQDLCLRARRHGHRLMVVPAAKMWHKVSASTGGSGTPLNKYHLARSSVLFYAKHTPRPLQPLVALYRLGSAVRTIARAWRDRRPAVVKAYLQGLADGIRLLRKPIEGLES
ncbi:MAG: glycosyltransferase family 2 protein, partial [Anaerolineae bacterium]